MTCPRCKLESPPGADTCDCGYVFALPPDHQTPRHNTNPASQVRPILGMVGILILGAAIAAWANILLPHATWTGGRNIVCK